MVMQRLERLLSLRSCIGKHGCSRRSWKSGEHHTSEAMPQTDECIRWMIKKSSGWS